MGKLTGWIVAAILLCGWGQSINGNNRLPEHSSVGIYKKQKVTVSDPDKGEIVLFLLNVAIGEFGKLLDKGYKCPVYCDVHHKHYYWENNEERHEQKSNI